MRLQVQHEANVSPSTDVAKFCSFIHSLHRTTSVSSANSATKLVDAAFASASAIGYRGSSLGSLNEVGTYLKRCANFQEALENCDKLLIESAASQ